MRKKLLSLFAAFAMAATVSAQVTFTCTAGTNMGGYGGIQCLFDNKTNTKFCGNGGPGVYALVTASEPVYVWGYEMTTANDNENYGRCIKRWSLFGTNDIAVASDPNATGWVTLSDFTDKDYEMVWRKNFYTQRFFCEKDVARPFKYYKLVLNHQSFIQFSEFKFLYETNSYVSYNWKESSDNNSKKAVDLRLDQKWEGGNLAASKNWFTIETADGMPHAVKKYSFSTHDDGQYGDRAPKSWKIEGSNDNTSWVTIDEVVDDATIQNANYTTFDFTPSNTTDEFRYIKVTLNAMKGTGWTQVGEFHVQSTTDIPAKKVYCEELISVAKADPFDANTLGSDDPWYVEYKSYYDSMDENLASSISTGNYDNLVAQLEKMHKINVLMKQFKNGANYVPFDGTPCWGDGHWSQLFDGLDGREGRKGTKWGGYFSGSGAVQYVIFRVKTAFAPYFYKLVTGGDTYTYKGRNWSSWNVYGANFDKFSDATHDATAWTLLDSRTNITEEYLPFENNYPAAFDFNKGVTEPYYYFKVEIVDSYTRNQGTQMNEMYLCTQEEFEATRAPLVAEFTEFFAGLSALNTEASMADKKTEFSTLYNELQNTSDPVRLTKVYNMLVALRAELECSVVYMDLLAATGAEEGTVDFELGTAAQLKAFANAVNAGRPNLNATITAEIDLDGETMVLMGTQDFPYSGIFDGQGKAIKNFTYANTAQNNVALFAQTSGATIQNVLLTGANINGGANAAGIVGNAQKATTIQQCAVVNSYIEGRDHVAAIAGNAAGNTEIINNYSDATIVSRQYQAGGMVGTVLAATITNNLFTGSVTCNNGGDASGLVSRVDANGYTPVIERNVVAATAVTGGKTYPIINLVNNERTATFNNNYVLSTTTYTPAYGAELKEGQNGTEVSFKDATHKSFYYGKGSNLMWNVPGVWNFFAAGNFPVLSYMPVDTYQTISVSSALYATAVAAEDLDFSAVSGVTAYAALLNGTSIELQEITAVPKGEPFVIKAPAAGDYQIPFAVEYASPINNDLEVSDVDIVVNAAYYVLAVVPGGVGFVRAADGTTIKAGKGYVLIPSQRVTISEVGYATLVADANLDFTNSDVSAFTVQISGDFAALTPITFVPANEAVVIKGSEGTYDIFYTKTAVSAVENNDLKSSDVEIEANGTQYVLSKPEGEKVGFYKADLGSMIAPRKGYLEITGASGVNAFVFFDDATGIQDLNEGLNDSDSLIYNLAGQRMSKMQKGINIVNRKKVLK